MFSLLILQFDLITAKEDGSQGEHIRKKTSEIEM